MTRDVPEAGDAERSDGRRRDGERAGLGARVLLGAIRVYQLGVSPLLPALCRFEPSCSRYAEEAVRVHGAARGAWLASRRIVRCRPGGGSGYDPVPAPRATGAVSRDSAEDVRSADDA